MVYIKAIVEEVFKADEIPDEEWKKNYLGGEIK